MVGSRASLGTGQILGPPGWIPSPTANQALWKLHILAEEGEGPADGTVKLWVEDEQRGGLKWGWAGGQTLAPLLSGGLSLGRGGI